MQLTSYWALEGLCDFLVITAFLVFLQAEFESRCEMYEAQVTKMQRSLERGDTEKAKIEEDLAKAMALKSQGDRQVGQAHSEQIL